MGDDSKSSLPRFLPLFCSSWHRYITSRFRSLPSAEGQSCVQPPLPKSPMVWMSRYNVMSLRQPNSGAVLECSVHYEHALFFLDMRAVFEYSSSGKGSAATCLGGCSITLHSSWFLKWVEGQYPYLIVSGHIRYCVGRFSCNLSLQSFSRRIPEIQSIVKTNTS